MYRLLKEYKQLNKGAKNYLKNQDNLLRNGWTLEIDSCYKQLDMYESNYEDDGYEAY